MSKNDIIYFLSWGKFGRLILEYEKEVEEIKRKKELGLEKK